MLSLRIRGLALGAALSCLLLLTASRGMAKDATLLNASYDVTRELYRDVNAAFIASWKKTSGATVTINQSHGGSSKQARAVIEGLQADVVTMNQTLDIDMIAEKGHLLPADWASRLPNQSVPFTSTIIFLVRDGNPKKIRDWADLVRPGVVPIIPNPKTSGNGRYSYLAAWAHALRAGHGDEAAAADFVGKLFKAVPVLDTGGRGATTTFIERGIGDVLLTFENEAYLAAGEASGSARRGRFAIVAPAVSILAELPVAVVDRVAARNGNTELATTYLRFLYSDEAQAIAAHHHLRPATPAARARAAERFPALELVTVAELGGWAALQRKHFVDGALFDQLYAPWR